MKVKGVISPYYTYALMYFHHRNHNYNNHYNHCYDMLLLISGNTDGTLSLGEPPKLARGDKALCRFRFLFRPEFLKVGTVLVIREGRTTGVGTIVSLDVLRDWEW